MILNNNISQEKIFFTPGDVCMLKQDIPNKPMMVVHRVERSIMRNRDGKDILKGVKCRWFTENGFLQEAIFSTKDLILVENGR
jgi:uncharacterized protein YodC (DUF2158 family)